MLHHSKEHWNFPCQTQICCLQDDFILADPTKDNNIPHLLSRLKPSLLWTAGASDKPKYCIQLFVYHQRMDADQQGDVRQMSSFCVLSTPIHPQETFTKCLPSLVLLLVWWDNHWCLSLQTLLYQCDRQHKGAKEMTFKKSDQNVTKGHLCISSISTAEQKL